MNVVLAHEPPASHYCVELLQPIPNITHHAEFQYSISVLQTACVEFQCLCVYESQHSFSILMPAAVMAHLNSL